MMFLDAAERASSRDRLVYITDMAAILGGMFGGGDTLTEHIDELKYVVNGE